MESTRELSFTWDGIKRLNEYRGELHGGYSSESLRMLETAEGQLNAVFACFGSAIQHAQLFEQALERFLSAYNRITSKSVRPDDIGRRLTLGQLLSELHKHVATGNDSIEEDFRIALEERNHLAHKFFLERDSELSHAEGRKRLLDDLIRIEIRFDRCRVAINAMRIAMCRALDVEDEWSDEHSDER